MFGLTASYRPPSTNVKLYIEELNEYLLSMCCGDVEIFMGDVNINIGDSADLDSLIYQTYMGQNGFISRIESPTRVTNNTASVIDHIYLKLKSSARQNLLSCSGVLKTSITDHWAVFLSIKSTSNQRHYLHNPSNKRTFTDREKLNSLLMGETWRQVLDDSNPQTACTNFMMTLRRYIEDSSYTKKVKVENYKKKQCWITVGLITSIKRRDKMKVWLRKNFSPENNRKYTEYRNLLNSLIKKTKELYYANKFKLAGKDIKKHWRILNEMNNICRIKSDIPREMIDDKGCTVIEPEDKANAFNEFFVNIGKRLAGEINRSPIDSDLKSQRFNASIFLRPVDENELVSAISSLKNSTSPGPDGIASSLIKQVHLYILKPLAHIVNLCFSSGTVPIEWKESHVSCVYKSGDKSLLTNYRPISVINNFSKIFEKCLKSRLTSFFEENDILGSRQFGFRENVSTTDAIQVLVEGIIRSLDDNKKVLTVFLDLAKAFDTVDHHLLFERLDEVGIRGVALNLIKNYLSGRIQRVKMGDVLSKPLQIDIGIPQGTVLGPILFLVFIGWVLRVSDLDMIAYADDSVLIFKGDSWDEVRRCAVNGLRKIHRLLSHCLLSLNLCKTKFMTFSLREPDQPQYRLIHLHKDQCNQLGCECPVIEKTVSIKYLGVTIDQHLRWSEHALYLVKRLKKLFYIFYNIRYVLSAKECFKIYEAIVLSILRYGVVVWGSMCTNNMGCLDVVHKTILKIILKLGRRFRTEKLYVESGQLSIKQLYIYEVILYQIKSEKKFINHIFQTRQILRGDLFVPKFNKKHSQKSLCYHGPKFYNILPYELKASANVKSKSFRKTLRTYITVNSSRFEAVLSS